MRPLSHLQCDETWHTIILIRKKTLLRHILDLFTLDKQCPQPAFDLKSFDLCAIKENSVPAFASWGQSFLYHNTIHVKCKNTASFVHTK